MRDWLVKPLLIVLAIVVIAAMASFLWLRSLPATANAAGNVTPTSYHARLHQAMHDLENQ